MVLRPGQREDDEDDDFPEHPLFPVEDEGDEHPDVSFIQIFRFEDGRLVCAPDICRGNELRSLSQIEEKYGGGNYELWARCRGKANPDEPGVIAKKRKYIIGGSSKPLGNYTAPSPAAVAAQGAPMIGDNLLVAMMQMQQAQQAAAAAQAQQQSQQFMAMMAQMMATSKTESSQMMQMMIQMQQSSQQSMVSMITAMLANKGGGPEEMAKFLQIAKSLNGDSSNGDKKDSGELDFPSMLENIADAVAGVSNIMTARAAASGNGAPPQMPPPFVPAREGMQG